MFWSARENLGGLKHWSSRLCRVLLRRPRTAPVERLKAQGNEVEVLCDSDGSVLHCRFCGYAMMTLPLANGTVLTVCSTVGDNVVQNRERMARWVETFPEFCAKSGAKIK